MANPFFNIIGTASKKYQSQWFELVRIRTKGFDDEGYETTTTTFTLVQWESQNRVAEWPIDVELLPALAAMFAQASVDTEELR